MLERVPDTGDVTVSRMANKFLLKPAFWLKRQTTNK